MGEAMAMTWMGVGHRFGRQHYNGFQNGTDYEDSLIRLILKSVVVLAHKMTVLTVSFTPYLLDIHKKGSHYFSSVLFLINIPGRNLRITSCLK